MHLVDKAAQVCGSRYALAKRLHANEGFLSRVARGLAPTPPTLAARMADLVGDDPRAAALEAITAQEHDPEKRRELHRLFKLAPGTAASIAAAVAMVLLGAAPNDAQAQSGASGERLYIMSSLRRLLRLIAGPWTVADAQPA